MSCRLGVVLVSDYGFGWREMPAAAALACYVQALELPAMIRALRNQPPGPSAWR